MISGNYSFFQKFHLVVSKTLSYSNVAALKLVICDLTENERKHCEKVISSMRENRSYM
jgi:hypothetical protein